METCKLDDRYLVNLVDGLLFRKGKNHPVGSKTQKNRYISCKLGGKKMRVHQAIYYQKYGEIPVKPFLVDHINEIKGDNRIQNLQKITYSENTKRSWKPRSLEKKKCTVDYLNGNTQKFHSIYACAKMLEVNNGVISRIVDNKYKGYKYTHDKDENRVTVFLTSCEDSL